MCLLELSGNFHYTHEGIVLSPIKEKIITTICVFGRGKMSYCLIQALM